MSLKQGIFASEEEIYDFFRTEPAKYLKIKNMHPFWKEKMMGYMLGRKTLPFTYDPFFKMIFNPELYPERLSSFISAIIGEDVEIEKEIPVEHVLHDGSTVVIMDLIVRLSNGARANVEIQKNAEGFPDERISCYSADNVMQEYQVAKLAAGDGKFTYKDVSKVYTIVIYEKSKPKYKEKRLNGQYIHHGKVAFDTGIQLDLLEEYFIVNLDIFTDSEYTRSINRLNGWLRFLTTEDMDDVERVMEEYPWLRPIYEEVGANLYDPKEVFAMYSDALRILDENSMRLFVDELMQERDEAIHERDSVAKERDEWKRQSDEKDKIIKELQDKLAQL